MSTTLGPIAVSFAAAWTVARTASARMVAVDVMKAGQGRSVEVDSVMWGVQSMAAVRMALVFVLRDGWDGTVRWVSGFEIVKGIWSDYLFWSHL